MSAVATSTVHRKQSAISPAPMCIPPICAIMAPPNIIIPSIINRGICRRTRRLTTRILAARFFDQHGCNPFSNQTALAPKDVTPRLAS